jgi:two-component system C4-dicarboxylate transport sensor histidine kinase DctB
MNRHLRRGLVAAGAAVVVIAALVVHALALRAYLAEGRGRAEATLALTLRALDGHLRRFEVVPALLAEQEEVRRLFQAPDDPATARALNVWLAAKAAQVDAAAIMVLAPDGTVLAASDHDRRDSAVGRNVAAFAYFQRAMAGERGRFYGIVTPAGARGYYFAAPVRDDTGRVEGVVAVTVGLDEIEADWRRQDARILVIDPEGIVFLSSDPDWLFRATEPRDRALVARTAASRRYAETPVGELPRAQVRVAGQPVLRVAAANGSSDEFVGARRLMPLVGWTVEVLLDTTPMRAQARLATAAGGLAVVLAMGTLTVIIRRRARRERAKAMLERRVVERTADLARVNARLEAEVAERVATETELRRTQADLIQAGKLAALGTMSAALSHEINQPLAAARNYADSAAVLIDRGDTARARENVGQIVTLIDRMAAIARHLRSVARKPETPLKDISLSQAVDEALATVAPRLAAACATVTVAVPDDIPAVRCGPVRLQQVLVNVLSNAADAVDDRPDRRIEVAAKAESGRVLLTVRDHGPGVAPAIADRIFDPFFTTKRVGSGLGLGLSISYNIMKDFGGDLRVANHPQGGAVFTVDLQASPAVSVAAQ